MVSRKGNWSEKEDRTLANKVIQYTQSGKTQLEAFKDAAKEMNRTPDACGYRWNAKLRHNFQEDLKQVKQDTNSNGFVNGISCKCEKNHTEEESPLQLALSYLERLDACRLHSLESIRALGELQKENKQLKKKLAY